MKSYKELRVWNTAMKLVEYVYGIIETFPNEELFVLSYQMRKSVISIPSNISEGFLRNSPKEFQQFLYIALGSCAELETQTLIAARRNYMTSVVESEIIELIDHIMRMLRNLIKRVNMTKQS